MEPLIHFMIPFILLMFVGIEIKKAWAISLLALIPDLDALFHIHRSISHSIIIPIIVAVPLLLLCHKNRILIFLALFAVVSDSFLDLFVGYTPILWPLYNYLIWIHVRVMAHIGSSLSFSLSSQILTKPISFETFQYLDVPILTLIVRFESF